MSNVPKINLTTETYRNRKIFGFVTKILIYEFKKVKGGDDYGDNKRC